jgi:hypothetical protein
MKATVARQQCGKQLSAATDTHVTMEETLEAMFSMWSMSRIHSENKQKILVRNRWSEARDRSRWLES